MLNKLLKYLGFVLPFAAVACGIVLLLADPLPLQSIRNHLFDQYQRWHPRAYQPVPVRVIDIDEESLARLGELVARLNDAGVAAIGFDVVFAEPDRTAPQAIADLWQLQGKLRNELAKLPDHDTAFAASIAAAPVVVGFTLERGQADKNTTNPASTADAKLPRMPFRYINAGEPPDRWLHAFATAITSLPLFEQAAQGNGALSFVPDSDGQGAKNIILKAAEEKGTGLAEIRIGEFTVPTTASGEMWVHYTMPVAERYITAWKVFAGEVPAEFLEGHLVLVGASAQGLMDLRFSPLGRIMPGVEAHAQALEQILSEHYLLRPGWATAAEAVVIVIVIGGLLIGFLALRTEALRAAIVGAVLTAGVLGGGWYAFREHGLLLNTVTPGLVLSATFVLASLLHHFMSEREQRWIKKAFSRYVSPNRVSHLVEHPDDMELGGRRQECSFIFIDLAGFTTLMESIDPGEAVSLLNAYLDEMIAIAFRQEGTLDRIVGDAVAIMFSAPVPQADHRARALACALEMDAFASRYAADLQAKGVRFGKTRIGIHSGEVIVGNFGGSTMFDYRALGDPVNTVARLESVNKHLGTKHLPVRGYPGRLPGGHRRTAGRQAGAQGQVAGPAGL